MAAEKQLFKEHVTRSSKWDGCLEIEHKLVVRRCKNAWQGFVTRSTCANNDEFTRCDTHYSFTASLMAQVVHHLRGLQKTHNFELEECIHKLLGNLDPEVWGDVHKNCMQEI